MRPIHPSECPACGNDRLEKLPQRDASTRRITPAQGCVQWRCRLCDYRWAGAPVAAPPPAPARELAGW